MSTLTQFYGASAANLIPVELLIVGGGGGGRSITGSATNIGGFGGGSGRLIFSSTTVSKSLAYTITIGGGGAASATINAVASPGSSSFFGLIEANGGQGYNQFARQPLGGSVAGSAATSGVANTILTIAATPVPVFMQINSADNFYYSLASIGGFSAVNLSITGGAGGGGAGSWGSGSPSGGSGGGGSGFSCSIVGSSVSYASGGPGKYGNSDASGIAGTANTGNGGGGASTGAAPSVDYLGGNGGSGGLIISFKNTYPVPTSITGTYDEPTRTGYRVYRFTGSGSITF